MNKQSISHITPCIQSITFLCGCINYTNVETKYSAHTLVIKKHQKESKKISPYIRGKTLPLNQLIHLT